MAATVAGPASTNYDKSTLEPSENWDDDFEFQDSGDGNASSRRGHKRRSFQQQLRDDDHVAFGLSSSQFDSKAGSGGDGLLGSKMMDFRKLSVASSAITEDWDLEEGPSTASIPQSAIPILQGTLSASLTLPNPNIVASTTPSMPTAFVTENWDDDFEYSRNSPAKRDLGPIRKVPAAMDEELEESWDEEDEDDTNDFGFGGKDEEDRTVTARSRRAAIVRAIASNTPQKSPPPPVPPIRTSSLGTHVNPHPHPFPRTPNSPGAPRPRSRSPTSTASVFSVPNTVSAYSYSSTTHLNGHPRSHRPNSAFALLPPSPPIHKERERRRLRKKSRPVPQGVFELGEVGMSSAAGAAGGRYSFSDGEGEGGSQPQPRGAIGSAYASQMQDMRSRESFSSIDEGVDEDVARPEEKDDGAQRGRGPGLPAPLLVPATPTKGGTAAAMLSRIGSVKKWGVAVRNRRRGSTTPSEVAAQQDQEREQELQRTPRPRSSLSSFNAESSSHSRSRYIPRNFNRHSATVTSTTGVAGVPGSPTSSSSHWFFRASSTGSPSHGASNLGRSRIDAVAGSEGDGLSRGHSMRTTSSARSGGRSRSRSRSRPPDAIAGRGGRDGDGGLRGNALEAGNGREVATPNNKLIKRKSLGFVKLGIGSNAGGHDGSGSKYPGLGLGRAAEKEKENAKDDSDEPRSRRKSFSRFLKDRAERESSHSPGSPFVVVDAQQPAPSAPPTPTPGSRSFMGSVRRISLVGRHKRSKSGAVLGEVLPSPSSAFFRQPGPVPQEKVPPVPYSLPLLPGSASASASQLSLKMAASSSSALNLPLPSAQKRSSSGKRMVSNSSQTSSVLPPSTSSSVSKASVHRGRTPEEDRIRPSIGAGKRSLDFDLNIFQANVKQAAKDAEEQEEDEVVDDMKTPSKSGVAKPAISSLEPPPPLPLLPPIELHPPSPPNTITPTSGLGPSTSERGKASRSLSAAFGTGSGTDALSPATSTSSIFFTPTSSPNKSHKNSTKLSPGPKSPASQQSASLGRSTAGVVATGVSAVDGGLGTTPRRNSLGDLKIPARISQAQVALRRDLGMVREFASNVEQIKDLQQTYNSLVSEVQTILADHAHRHAQQAFLAASMSSAQPQPRSASPSFLSGLAIRTRGRSNTNPSPTPPAIASQRPSMDESPAPGQVPSYKELASKFYTINSKYRLSWECAELLIELGGTGAGENTTTSTANPAAVVTSAPANTDGASSPFQHAQGPAAAFASRPGSSGKGRERAITLVGDIDKPSNLKQHQHSHTGPPANPPPAESNPLSVSASQPNSSWRASTGRHDLSHRQLSLLREMLNNTHAIVSSSAVLTSGADDGLGDAGDDSQQSIPEDSIPGRRIPLAVQSLQAVHMTVNAAANLNVNRDWRWGDARNSTITLPSEEDGGGDQKGGKDKRQDGKARRKSGRMGMAGFRDMLRALRRGNGPDSTGGTSTKIGGGFLSQSTTSLSTQSSIGSRARGGHRYTHPKMPHPPATPSTQQQPVPSQGRRRAKTSTGPESIRSTNTAAQATLTNAGIGLGMKPSTSSSYGAGAGKPSPRRPSLASIFRIGSVKNRPGSVYVGADDIVQPLSPPLPPSATTMASPSTDHEGDLEGRSEDSHSRSHDHTFSGGSSTGEEEDWDRMDSASDLDAAARAMGVCVGTDNGATVRGGAKLQKNRKGRSPYLQREMYDPSPPMPTATDHTSPISTQSGYSVQHSVVSKRSFNNSQSSLSRPHHGSPLTTSHVPTRTTKLSNVNEHQDDRHSSLTKPQRAKAPARPSSSRSNFATTLSPSNTAQHGSMRSVVPPSHLSPSTSLPVSSLVSPLPDPMKLAMTPENIKPLLENAKEVHARLGECIEEIMSLLGRVTVPVSAVSEPVAI